MRSDDAGGSSGGSGAVSARAGAPRARSRAARRGRMGMVRPPLVGGLSDFVADGVRGWEG